MEDIVEKIEEGSHNERLEVVAEGGGEGSEGLAIEPCGRRARAGWALLGLKVRRQGVSTGHLPVEARSLARTLFPVALNFLNHDRRLWIGVSGSG